ncbi:hypothetical protein M9H77_36447 [Catharanthus roseus]|uniref:Uncharacterized protein n=1 Tax=Catharanthus roseus TaxID=4058 RepID=A0ACB9ZU06_CATRO|nr:hypothetical protein M9H77_36447 [Catharanthus roseus]
MARLGAHRGDNDLSPVTDRICRVEGLTVTTSSRSLRGRHTTFDIPSTPVRRGLLSNYQIYRLGLVLLSHRTTLTLRGLDPEPAMVGYLQIGGEDDQRVHDDDDDNDDDDEPVPVAPMASAAPASLSGSRPHPGKGKGLTGSFMSIMSKISGSRNKRPNKARDVSAPTQKKKGGPVDPMLILSYDVHMAGCIWHGHDRDLLKSRSRYIALTSMDIHVLSHVCTYGETGRSVLQAVYPAIPNVES